ncbi:MAG: TetR/AcrR family transcriptional regulator [Spirochaetes bacterium]|nr:TetR/AcrR family transcriptional regulator [Spirochaetota bacterium]
MENSTISSKKKIMEIAFNLFSSQGYAATSVRQIASTAEVNISSIGYYFGGKEGLYREVIKSQLKIFTDLLSDKISKEKNIKKRIKFFAETLVDSLMGTPSILRIITRELVNDEPEISYLSGDMISNFTGIFSSFFQDIDTPRPDNIDTNSGIFDIFMLLAPVYFYFIARQLIDNTILIDDNEIKLFREKLILETYERGLKILEKLNKSK